MQVTELEKNGLKRQFRVKVEANVINKQTEAELKQAGKNVRIPGFRPGNVPMKVLQQRYGKSVQADVLRNVINRSSGDVITQQKLKPANQPQIAIEDYKDDGDLTYTMTIESFPDVPDVNYEKISLNRKVVDFAEKDIAEAAKRIAERSPKMTKKEGGKAAKGDIVTIDFKGSVGGKLFQGGTAENFRLELGSNQFIPGFEDQLIGAKEGEERTVKVKFPDAYHSTELAGKDSEFAVKVHGIEQPETPEVDEEFAKSRGFADLAAFKEAVKTQLTREYDQMIRSDLKKQLFDQLEAEYDFPLPESMVESEFGAIWERLKQAQAEGDETLVGKSDDELKSEYSSIAKRRVKLGILLAEVGNRNKLEIAREELTRAVMQQASMFPGQEDKVIEFYRKNPTRMNDLRGPILEEKAVDFILAKAKFKDKTVSAEELMAGDEEEEGGKKKASKAKSTKKKADQE